MIVEKSYKSLFVIRSGEVDARTRLLLPGVVAPSGRHPRVLRGLAGPVESLSRLGALHVRFGMCRPVCRGRTLGRNDGHPGRSGRGCRVNMKQLRRPDKLSCE